MKERILILTLNREQPGNIINSNKEIYGACKHQARFHRYTTGTTSSTDDGINPERVKMPENNSHMENGTAKKYNQNAGLCMPTDFCIKISTNTKVMVGTHKLTNSGSP